VFPGCDYGRRRFGYTGLVVRACPKPKRKREGDRARLQLFAEFFLNKIVATSAVAQNVIYNGAG